MIYVIDFDISSSFKFEILLTFTRLPLKNVFNINMSTLNKFMSLIDIGCMFLNNFKMHN